jgi:acyl-CoA reductase-like NAD-dependent aldehyde dehydrogenase
MAAADLAPTDVHRLEEALARLREGAPRWARATLPERIALAHEMMRGTYRNAARMVREACAAKGLPPEGPLAGEEWLSGPYVIVRLLRQLARSMLLLERNGNPPVGRLDETIDGRLSVRVFPTVAQDALLFRGVSAEVHLLEGVDEDELHRSRARFHKAPDHGGRVCLVLGAGNINSIPATDVAHKLFNEGKVCVLKLNPVNAYLGPIFEDAFAEAIALGVLAVVQGGAAEGSWLAHHAAVDEVHVTGSDRTHDLLVWGPPGPERAERMARNRPVLAKEVTSELGGVSPVLVVPGPWDDRSLRAQAESIAGGVTHNASFDCNAAKLLVMPRGWDRAEEFVEAVGHYLALAPPRRAWYPGAFDRYRQLTEGRADVRRFGAAASDALPWTLLRGLDAASDDPAFRTEPFCALLSETTVGSDDPLEYLARAVPFANDRVWGTLSACLCVHPRTMADPTLGRAVEEAIRKLRFGTVSVDVWAAYGFGFGTTPWGAFPGSTLTDIQSGRGFVHNTLMLERVEKSVVRHPAWTFPKPPYFPTHRTVDRLGRRLVDLEVRGWSALPGVLAAGVGG